VCVMSRVYSTYVEKSGYKFFTWRNLTHRQKCIHSLKMYL